MILWSIWSDHILLGALINEEIVCLHGTLKWPTGAEITTRSGARVGGAAELLRCIGPGARSNQSAAPTIFINSPADPGDVPIQHHPGHPEANRTRLYTSLWQKFASRWITSPSGSSKTFGVSTLIPLWLCCESKRNQRKLPIWRCDYHRTFVCWESSKILWTPESTAASEERADEGDDCVSDYVSHLCRKVSRHQIFSYEQGKSDSGQLEARPHPFRALKQGKRK